LLGHVLLVQLLDGVPVEEQVLGDLLDRRRAAAATDEEGEPLGVQRVVGQPVQALAFDTAAPRAQHPADGEVEVDALVAAVQIAGATGPLIVVGAEDLPADAAERFFRRRRRVTTTAPGSPNSPRTCCRGTKPGNR